MNTDAHSLEFHLADEEATSELGARLARALDSVKSEILEKGLNIKLVGDLGAGKTYLMRSALRALGFEGRVKSPTFSLLEKSTALRSIILTSTVLKTPLSLRKPVSVRTTDPAESWRPSGHPRQSLLFLSRI